MALACTALLVLTAVTGAAEIEDGIALYQNKDFRGALAAFGRAGAEKQPAKRRAIIHVYIGIIQFRFGLVDDARSSFEESLDHDARVAFPDPSQGGASRLFQEVKAELEKETEPKRKTRRRRKRRRSKAPSDEPRTGAVERPAPPPPPALLPAPPPPPTELVVVPEPEPEPSSNVGAWVVTGGGAAAAITGVVLIAVGRSNGNAAQDPDRNALDAESLYNTHRIQVSAGIGGLAVAGVAAGVAAYLFATQ